MKKTTIASLVALAFAHSVTAAETIDLKEVVVTSTRFDESNDANKANLKVITKEEIANSPAISIPDILRMQAGLNVTSLYGNQGVDASVDIRGFGESATSNTLVLLDGQRLNQVDGGSIQWASIPLQSLERIEILSGGGSVLYGDRATGGVINLITNKSGKPAASLTTTLGSYGYKSLDGYLAGGEGNFYFNTFVHTADSNGWRKNANANQWSLSGRLGACFNASDLFVDYAVYSSTNGLPSSIRRDVYENNPKSARTLYDSQTKEGVRLRPGFSVKLTEDIELASEFAVTKLQHHSNYVSFSSISDRDVDTYSLTPRVKWNHGLASLKSVSVLGYDYYQGEVLANNHGSYDNSQAKQHSHGLYWQNNTALTTSFDVNAGVRYQQTSQEASQGNLAGKASGSKTVYDFGLVYHEAHLSAYTKLGTSFRSANTDELFNYDAATNQTYFSGQIIKPQTSLNKEFGVNFKSGKLETKLALYQSDIKNEIGYDGALGINTNYDPTRHQGLEANVKWNWTQDIVTKLSYAYSDAIFDSGIYDGKKVPLVASNSAHAQIVWEGLQYGKYVAQLNYLGERFTSGDFNNTLKKLPSYTTLDLRVNWDVKPLTLSLSALNVTDKKYSPYALYAYDPATGYTKQDYFYFPSDGRTIYLSARYDFK